MIDYERETGAQRSVDKLLETLNCTCSIWNNGVRCCKCKKSCVQLEIVLFESGPENVLERLGYHFDRIKLHILKSRAFNEYLKGSRFVRGVVDGLVELVKVACGTVGLELT